MCPAAIGKIRCPLRPQSMTLDRARPEILAPPEHPPACCAQQTITVPPDVAAKTRQKHDYPSPPTAAPTHGAPAPSAPSQPSRTPPPPPSPAAGAASPAWPRSRCGWPACSPSATSASSAPGTSARPRTTGAQPPGSRPEPASAAARPSPASAPPRHNSRGFCTPASGSASRLIPAPPRRSRAP